MEDAQAVLGQVAALLSSYVSTLDSTVDRSFAKTEVKKVKAR